MSEIKDGVGEGEDREGGLKKKEKGWEGMLWKGRGKSKRIKQERTQRQANKTLKDFLIIIKFESKSKKGLEK